MEGVLLLYFANGLLHHLLELFVIVFLIVNDACLHYEKLSSYNWTLGFIIFRHGIKMKSCRLF
jgi:hypothetical protein